MVITPCDVRLCHITAATRYHITLSQPPRCVISQPPRSVTLYRCVISPLPRCVISQPPRCVISTAVFSKCQVYTPLHKAAVYTQISRAISAFAALAILHRHFMTALSAASPCAASTGRPMTWHATSTISIPYFGSAGCCNWCLQSNACGSVLS